MTVGSWNLSSGFVINSKGGVILWCCLALDRPPPLLINVNAYTEMRQGPGGPLAHTLSLGFFCLTQTAEVALGALKVLFSATVFDDAGFRV